MKVAELNLAAEKLQQKMKKLACWSKKQQQRQKQLTKDKQVSKQQTVVASGNTTFAAQVQAVASSESATYTPVAVKQRPTYSTNASSIQLENVHGELKH